MGAFKTILEENLKNIKLTDQYVVLVTVKQHSIVIMFIDSFFLSFLSEMCVCGRNEQSLLNTVSLVKDHGWLVVRRMKSHCRL